MSRPMAYANLFLGCVLIEMHWGLAAGAGAFFIGLALVGAKGTEGTKAKAEESPIIKGKK